MSGRFEWVAGCGDDSSGDCPKPVGQITARKILDLQFSVQFAGCVNPVVPVPYRGPARRAASVTSGWTREPEGVVVEPNISVGRPPTDATSPG